MRNVLKSQGGNLRGNSFGHGFYYDRTLRNKKARHAGLLLIERAN
jgi:hypothetical protein